MTPRIVIFDHLVDAPRAERRFFSAVARAMRASPWWLTVSPWTKPADVSGELADQCVPSAQIPST